MNKPKNPVRVFYFSPQHFYAQADTFLQVMSDGENEKAGRFKFDTDRLNYIICHGLLRYILSKEIALPPSEIKFIFEKNGKPVLADNKIYFNLSHTKWLCAIAVSDTGTVGIDTEKIREHKGYKAIAEKYFTPEEVSVLEISENPLTDFFRFWTRKEAFVKALGTGLNTPLAKINTLVSESSQVVIPDNTNGSAGFYVSTSFVNDHIISVASADKFEPDFQEIKKIVL